MSEDKMRIAGEWYPVEGQTSSPLPDLGEEDRWTWQERASESAIQDVGYGVYVFPLDDGQNLVITTSEGYPISVRIESPEPLAMLVADLNPGDIDPDEWLVEFDLDPKIEPAPADYDGPCRVWRAPQYYTGTMNAPRAGWVREEDECGRPTDIIREFSTRQDAQAYVDDYYGAPSEYEGVRECCVLAHGQAGPDALVISAA